MARYCFLSSTILLRVVTADKNLDTRIEDDFEYVAHSFTVQPVVTTVNLSHYQLADVEFHKSSSHISQCLPESAVAGLLTHTPNGEIEKESAVLE